MTLSPSESAVKGANTPEVGERGALASRFTAGLFWSLRAVLSTQNSPGFLDPTADSGQQSPCERYQADQRSSLVSAQTGSWVRVTKRGRKANSAPTRELPPAPQTEAGSGRPQGPTLGPVLVPWARARGCWTVGLRAHWLHLLSALDRQRTVFKKIFFLKKPGRGRNASERKTERAHWQYCVPYFRT